MTEGIRTWYSTYAMFNICAILTSWMSRKSLAFPERNDRWRNPDKYKVTEWGHKFPMIFGDKRQTVKKEAKKRGASLVISAVKNPIMASHKQHCWIRGCPPRIFKPVFFRRNMCAISVSLSFLLPSFKAAKSGKTQRPTFSDALCVSESERGRFPVPFHIFHVTHFFQSSLSSLPEKRTKNWTYPSMNASKAERDDLQGGLRSGLNFRENGRNISRDISSPTRPRGLSDL